MTAAVTEPVDALFNFGADRPGAVHRARPAGPLRRCRRQHHGVDAGAGRRRTRCRAPWTCSCTAMPTSSPDSSHESTAASCASTSPSMYRWQTSRQSTLERQPGAWPARSSSQRAANDHAPREYWLVQPVHRTFTPSEDRGARNGTQRLISPEDGFAIGRPRQRYIGGQLSSSACRCGQPGRRDRGWKPITRVSTEARAVQVGC